ncbi:MAG: hypothetical protein NTX25_01010 [Proteobacteria bacterium]|nr:hypothetical protein [Pseudomonadota bacterium]
MQNLRRLNAKDLRSSFQAIPWEFKGKVCDVVGTLIEATLPG